MPVIQYARSASRTRDRAERCRAMIVRPFRRGGPADGAEVRLFEILHALELELISCPPVLGVQLRAPANTRASDRDGRETGSRRRRGRIAAIAAVAMHRVVKRWARAGRPRACRASSRPWALSRSARLVGAGRVAAHEDGGVEATRRGGRNALASARRVTSRATRAAGADASAAARLAARTARWPARTERRAPASRAPDVWAADGSVRGTRCGVRCTCGWGQRRGPTWHFSRRPR